MEAGFRFTVQYASQGEGETARDWLTQWVSEREDIIVAQGVSNSHELTDKLHPDTEEGMLVQFHAEYAFEAPDYGTFNDMWMVVCLAIADESSTVVQAGGFCTRETFTIFP